jgi:hypothetical protein
MGIASLHPPYESCAVIASEAKQSRNPARKKVWIASSLALLEITVERPEA